MHYAMLLFPGFEALDVFGPLEVLNVLSERTQIHLSLIASTLAPVSTRSPDPAAHRAGSVCAQELLPTGTFADFPTEAQTRTQTPLADAKGAIDVLIAPGGAGTRFPHIIDPVIGFVGRVAPGVRYVMSVCNGAGVLARAGVLDGKRATTNKMLWGATTALRGEVCWVKEARWVADGEVWTSSGVSAGIDMMLAFVREVYGKEMAGGIAREIEYVWDVADDGTKDPFA
jgi:transcriptional regulator GlxA family with amidase domain